MKKILFAVLFAAACGGTQKQSANQNPSAELTECIYSVPDTASAEEVQQVIDDAESGALDVCGDLLSASVKAAGVHAALLSIDPDERTHSLLIKFAMYANVRPSEP